MLKSGTKLFCIKDMADDFENHGMDFIEGKNYEIEAIGNGGVYVEAEDGSSVYFEDKDELLGCFKITV